MRFVGNHSATPFGAELYQLPRAYEKNSSKYSFFKLQIVKTSIEQRTPNRSPSR